MDSTDELAKKAEAKNTSPGTTLSKSLTTQQILMMGIVLMGLYFFVYVWKKIEPKSGLIIGAIGLAIIYLLSQKGNKGIIPIREARALLKQELRYMQRETKELPPGKINILPPFKLKNFDYKPNRYYIGFEVIQWNNLIKRYVGEVDPYDGKILGMVERTDGFDATDVKADVQLVRLKEDLWRDQYGHNTQRRY